MISPKPSKSGFAMDSSIPQTTLKIPMPAGAKPPPAAPSAKTGSSQKGK